MQSQERDMIAAFLEGAVSTGASSGEVAALVAKALGGVDQALSPIVGQRGMAALCKRSLHLSRPMHPWLPALADTFDACDAAEPALDLAPLTAALALRTSADAAEAGARLLQSLRALLISLIGESLSERLLRPVWATFLSGPSARDKTS